MPVSMALAGPAAEVLPIWLIFLVAGGVCPVMAVIAVRRREDAPRRTGHTRWTAAPEAAVS